MKRLLPMAYVFFILENSVFVNGKLKSINDNYTYRLMELEATGDNADLTRYKYPINNDDFIKDINPRAPHQQLNANDDTEDDDFIIIQEKHPKIKKTTNIPKDIEEEISHFRIPTHTPKRKIRKRKVKKIMKSQRKHKNPKGKTKPKDDEYDVVVEDMDSDNENDHHEEEEETEEKKEKIHKLTIRKKRPLKNSTDTSLATELPYRTIIETQSGAGSIPYKFQRPYTRVTRQRLPIQPLMLKENVDTLNPTFHVDDGDSISDKGVKPRDVSLILRTKNRNPRILIRRYKPYVNALTAAYPFVGQYPPVQPNMRKKRRRKKQRGNRRRKKLHHYHSYHGNQFAANQASCSNDHPLTQAVDTYLPPSSSNYDSIYPSMQSNGDYFYEPSKYSTLGLEAANEYASAPYDRYTYASDPPFTINDFALSTTEQPPLELYTSQEEGNIGDIGIIGNSGSSSSNLSSDDEEPMSAPYDVHEHENTVKLAANHQQETDESLEDDNDAPLQYDDTDTEEGNDGIASSGVRENVDYENDAEESLRFVRLFDKTTSMKKKTGNKKPIKKVDSNNINNGTPQPK